MKITNSWLLFGVVVVGLTCGHASLRAQPWNQGVSEESQQAARELFLEGNRLFQVPLFTKAAELYVAALAKWKHPAFYFNLALAQLNLGKEVEARESLELALRYGQEPLGAAQFQEAQKQLRELQRQLGRIHVICPTPGAEVTLDGVLLFTGPGSYQGWIKARDHELTAKRDGYLSEARRVTIPPGGLRDVELKLITLSEAADASRRWASWKPWAVVAGGGVVVAAAGVLHVFASRNLSAYDQGFLRLSCANPSEARPVPGCKEGQIPPTLTSQLTQGQSQKTIAISSYIAGGSIAAAGFMLLYLNRSRLTEQRETHLSGKSMSVMPSVSADMFGVALNVSH